MAKSNIALQEGQRTVSYSQYSMYNQCEYQWYLNYAKGHRLFKPGIFLLYGTSIHETIQDYLECLFNRSVKEAEQMDLLSLFEEKMLSNYKQDLLENKGEHYSTKEEFSQFLEDGKASLEWFKKNRGKYFTRKNTSLVGIEVPLLEKISEYAPNILLVGFIDLIVYDKLSSSYTIYDIKTSTRGWTDKEKKDQSKINQVLFYKKFYSEKIGVPQDKVDVKFFIIKRKVYEKSDFPIPRVQEFVPANGTKKVEGAYKSLTSFVEACFTPQGEYNHDRVYEKNTSSCKYCLFRDRPDLCDKKVL